MTNYTTTIVIYLLVFVFNECRYSSAGSFQLKEEQGKPVTHGKHHESKPRRTDYAVKPGALQVFILSGQSNMVGMAEVDAVNKSDPNHGYLNGTLRYQLTDPRTKEEFSVCVDSKGNWTVRDDVWVWINSPDTSGNGTWGSLSIGYGDGGDPHHIGPEYGFGFVMGDAIEEQVLIIKVSWGGKTFAQDFRPPSSGGTVGPYYEALLSNVKNVLGNLPTLFPKYDASRGYEVVGFGWWQGWNDGLNANMVAEYEKNMVNLISDLRKAWQLENMPVSIAVCGFRGFDNTLPQRRKDLTQAQFNAANATLHPNINNAQHPTVSAEETRGFWRDAQYSPADRVYHYNLNAETYWFVGKVMGQAIVKMMSPKNTE